ncbi:MAG TPA: PASTA domain-containing protein [Solirubrobacter sp.]|nr:PASTA domain-containing protein [Solirubrobacter sp.]
MLGTIMATSAITISGTPSMVVAKPIEAGTASRDVAITASATARPAATKVTVPSVRCKRLDIAEDVLHRRGLKVRTRGGGTFGIVVKSNWFVVSQSPRAGTRVNKGRRVTVYVDRDC